MQNYYFVFDMTPINEKSKEFIQVGIAERNPEFTIGKQYENKNYNISGDMSHHVYKSIDGHIMDYDKPHVDPVKPPDNGGDNKN